MHTGGKTFGVFLKSQTSWSCELWFPRSRRAGAGWHKSVHNQDVKTKVHYHCTTLMCTSGLHLQQSKEKPGFTKCFISPRICWSVLKSSEARMTPTRQPEETQRPKRERNPFDNSAHLCGVALHACPFLCAHFQVRWSALIRDGKTCLGVRRLGILVGGESWGSCCLCLSGSSSSSSSGGREREQRTEALLFTCELRVSHLHYTRGSTMHREQYSIMRDQSERLITRNV